MNKKIGVKLVEANYPIFIVGAPRSGTTFLQLLLAASGKFTVVPETHYFSYIKPIIDHLSARDEKIETLLKIIEGKPDIHLSDEQKSAFRISLEKIELSDSAILAALIEAISYNSQDHERWLEKTPKHIFHLNELWLAFPTAKVLNIVRDPRSVVSSFYYQRSFRSKFSKWRYFFNRIDIWNRAVRSVGLNKDRLITIKYESLVGNIDKEVGRAFSFVGLPCRDDYFLGFGKEYDLVVTSNETHKLMSSSGQLTDRSDIWKERISSFEVFVIERCCRDEMVRWGYEILTRPAGFTSIKVEGYVIFFRLVALLSQIKKAF